MVRYRMLWIAFSTFACGAHFGLSGNDLAGKDLSGKDLSGKVGAVRDARVAVVPATDVLPNIGDGARIAPEAPTDEQAGADAAWTAQGRVTAIERGVVIVELTRGADQVAVGHHVVFTSATDPPSQPSPETNPDQPPILGLLGLLGLRAEPVDGKLAQLLDLPRPTGLVVIQVEPDSPGARAGIKKRDVILRVGETDVDRPRQFEDAAASRDGKLVLTIWRDGASATVEVARPPEPPERAGPTATDAPETPLWIGAGIENNRDDITIRFLVPGAPAQRDGLRIDDRIVRIDAFDVRDATEFTRIVERSAPGQSVTITVLRNGERTPVTVTPEPRPSDAETAANLQKAAEAGDPAGQFLRSQQTGESVPAEYRLTMAQSIEWLRKSADAGFAGAQASLGSYYLDGGPIPAAAATGVAWLRKGAEQGNVAAMRDLSRAYGEGAGIAKNADESRRWHDRAFATGSLDAIVDRGTFYEFGHMFAKDVERAAEYYHLAASRGNAFGAFNYGRCLRKGIGVARDASEARRWLEKAAERGLAQAKKELDELNDAGTAPGGPTGGGATGTSDLGGAARNAQSAVVLLMTPSGASGTGFVISRTHRLVATNAHVADFYFSDGKRMTAHVNGVGASHDVEQVWFHPGVLRSIDADRVAIVRSMEPSHGPTFPGCPDVAVLQLGASGPALPSELSLATPEELRELLGQPIGLLGFPGHDRVELGADPSQITASYQQGVISRLTDFQMRGASSEDRRQYLQHTALGLNGASGSPLFLANGRVAGIHNSYRTQRTSQYLAQLSHGIRIDCLWELILYHKLDNLFPVPVSRDSVNLARFDAPDEEIEKYRKIWALLVEADRLMLDRKFAEAAQVCKQAIASAPEYPYGYAVRQEAFMAYAAEYQDRLSVDSIVKQTTFAMNDAKKYAELLPGAPNALLRYALALSNSGAAEARAAGDDAAGRAKYAEAIRICEQVMQSGSLTTMWQAEAFATRSVARQGLQDFDGSLEDINEAIRLLPESPNVFFQRSRLHSVRGEEELAASDRAHGESLRRKQLEAKSP
ncbi:MAG: PDZ domain-containing protein [Planctomycetes bacterium]|nr:PDZ domain-containing protein [Planctomycetota bacterium]